MNPDDELEIEKLGGLAGVGLPGSRLRCRAQMHCRELSPDELSAVEALFQARAGATQPAPRSADFFRYRITLHSRSEDRQIEVGEDDLMESLQQRLQDELR
ncbi:protealysin inhibitor emfourin [Hydrogenophaga aquatica]